MDIREIPYRLYLQGLKRSNTGKRLAKMLPVPLEAVRIINASPQVGKKSSAYFHFDREYLYTEVTSCKPDIILAFGKEASAGLIELGYNHIALPHPANRTLSNDDFASIRTELEAIFYENKVGV